MVLNYERQLYYWKLSWLEGTRIFPTFRVFLLLFSWQKFSPQFRGCNNEFSNLVMRFLSTRNWENVDLSFEAHFRATYFRVHISNCHVVVAGAYDSFGSVRLFYSLGTGRNLLIFKSFKLCLKAYFAKWELQRIDKMYSQSL